MYAPAGLGEGLHLHESMFLLTKVSAAAPTQVQCGVRRGAARRVVALCLLHVSRPVLVIMTRKRE